MAEKIKVLFIEPGKPAREIEMENTLKAFQNAVGGYIEVVPLASDLVLVVNEEGAIFGLPFNRYICGANIYGNIIVCSTDDDEFASLTPGLLKFWNEQLENAWKLNHGFTARQKESNE